MHRATPSPGGGLLTVTAHVLFDMTAPRTLLTDQALWPLALQEMPRGSVFDTGDAKPVSEYIIAGKAMAPGRRPVTGLKIAIDIGSLSKRLAVFGDRFWRQGVHGTDLLPALPFSEMPIDLAHAFGGEKDADNPYGKGARALDALKLGIDVPLPNVEYEKALIRSPADRPPPAFFGPLPLDSPIRLRHAGTYDQRWVKEKAPYPPDDFNPLFHSFAPPDQRLSGFFRGDEEFRIAGMNAEAYEVRGRLPNLRVRAFAHMPGEDHFASLAMRCETLVFFPNVTKVAIAYRGLLQVRDKDGDDVGAIMIAAEHAEDPPRPLDYYREVFRLRTDPRTAAHHALSDFQLLPEEEPRIRAERRAVRLARAAEKMAKSHGNRLWAVKKNMKLQGMPTDFIPDDPPEMPDDIPLVPLPTREEIASGAFDMAELIDDLDTMDKALRARTEQMLKEMEELRRDILLAVPPRFHSDFLLTPISDKLPEEDVPRVLDPAVGAGLRDLGAARVEARKPPPFFEDDADGDKIGAVLDDAFSLLAAFEEAPAPEDEEAHFFKAVARALKLPEGSLLYEARKSLEDFDPSLLNRSSPFSGDKLHTLAGSPLSDAEIDSLLRGFETPPPPLQPAVVSPAALLESMKVVGDALPLDMTETLRATDDIIARQASKLLKEDEKGVPGLLGALRRMEEQSGVETAGTVDPTAMRSETLLKIDEAEQDLDKALLEARLHTPAALYPADPLPEAAARRFGAFIAEKLLEGHVFRGADLAGVHLEGGLFEGCDLRETFFERAHLKGARFGSADLRRAVFTETDLEGADFSKARLVGANLSKGKFHHARFDGVHLKDVTIMGADFSGASLKGMRLEAVTFMDCRLDGADLSGAVLSRCQFVLTSAERLVARGMEVAETIFMKTRLRQADFSGASIFRTGFVQVEADSARFSHAHLRDSIFLGETALDGKVIKSSAKGTLFDHITARKMGWNMVDLDEAAFVRADCEDCLFNACRMRQVDGRAAAFVNTIFLKSDLTGSDFFAANFREARLNKANFTQTSLRHANLYLADLTDAVMHSADLTGTNLEATLLARKTDVS